MKLYRTMRVAGDGLPVTGDRPRMLGVRVPPTDPADVRPDAAGLVHPDAGGMSVSVGDPMGLPRHLRPPRLKGRLRPEDGEVYEASDSIVVAPLALRADGPPHHLVEPGVALAIDAFQAALHATRPHWSVVP